MLADAAAAGDAPVAGDEASDPQSAAPAEGGDVDDPLSTLASAAITAAKTENSEEPKVGSTSDRDSAESDLCSWNSSFLMGIGLL